MNTLFYVYDNNHEWYAQTIDWCTAVDAAIEVKGCVMDVATAEFLWVHEDFSICELEDLNLDFLEPSEVDMELIEPLGLDDSDEDDLFDFSAEIEILF